VHRLAPFIGAASAVVVLDQLSKALIRDWLPEGHAWPAREAVLRIAHVENPGAAFGILPGAGPFLLITAAIGAAAIVAYLLVAPLSGRWFAVALGLVLGGAVGNLIDRASRGTVTDFIDPTHYPAFNLADSSILIGVALLIALSFFQSDEGSPDGETRE
jgi:signal peptidase II